MNLAIKFKNKIYHRINVNNKNWLAIFVGSTGSGKSYSAISIADKFSKRGFSVEHHLIFTAQQFLEKLNNPKNIKRGDILVFDEAGVGMSSRDWQSTSNKILGSVLQTFRHMNVGVIFTVPAISMIDKQARILFHHIFEPVSIDRGKNKCYCKVHEFQYNNAYDKLYRKNMQFPDDDGYPTSMMGILISKPTGKLLEEYEKAKTEYTQKINKDFLEDLSEKDTKQEIKKMRCADCKSVRIEYTRKDNTWWCRSCGWLTHKKPPLTTK